VGMQALDTPVFGADNHLYESRDALTKFLPDRHRGAIDYVDVRGRTKTVVRCHPDTGRVRRFARGHRSTPVRSSAPLGPAVAPTP
jgi:hypothetical protein